jgi:hypothetical protein
MSNVIPGTNVVASPGVLSAFDQYKADKEARALAKQAEASAEVVVEKAKKVAKDKTPRTNDKKDAARKIFDANQGKGKGEIARLIAAELEITYANAYYYVTRVFK